MLTDTNINLANTDLQRFTSIGYVISLSGKTTKGRGQRMAAALKKLAQAQAFAEIDPVVWQEDVRQDRELPGRNQ